MRKVGAILDKLSFYSVQKLWSDPKDVPVHTEIKFYKKGERNMNNLCISQNEYLKKVITTLCSQVIP